MPWNFEGASCAEISGDFFFPENRTYTAENKMAMKICQSCVVQKECLEYALHHSVSGIWGGKTDRDRTTMRKKLGIIPRQIA